MFLVLDRLSPHKYHPLTRLLQNIHKSEHPRIQEPDFECSSIRQITFRRGFHADREVVRPKYGLLELGGENRREGYRQRLEGRLGVGVSPDELFSGGDNH